MSGQEEIIRFHNLVHTDYVLSMSERGRSNSSENLVFCVLILRLFPSVPSSFYKVVQNDRD